MFTRRLIMALLVAVLLALPTVTPAGAAKGGRACAYYYNVEAGNFIVVVETKGTPYAYSTDRAPRSCYFGGTVDTLIGST